MENPIPVHVVNSLHQLVHVMLDALLWQVVRSSLDSLIEVLFHQLEHQSESAGWFVVEDFDKLNYVRVRVQPL